jgi:CBS domain-containing protein
VEIRDVMTRDVRVTSPDDTIQDAAARMLELDIGVLPVGENDQLVGMVTDRDIAVRGVAKGHDPSTKVREVMSAEVKYCFDDEDVLHVAKNMADIQVRRLPVVNRAKRLVGIVSIGDLATQAKPRVSAEAVRGVSEQSDQHSQSAEPVGSRS